MKVLIAEDNVAIAKTIREGLEASGFTVQIVRDGARVVAAARAIRYSIILLDIMLPSVDGIEICRQLRQERINTPIIMLTARDGLKDRVAGLDSGADDYLSKPFEFDELLARMRALLRRESAIKSTEISIHDLYINTAKSIVRRGEREIILTPKEYSLLVALAQNAGSVLSKEVILERVWFDDFGQSNTVEVHVKNLRKKVDIEESDKLIHTIHGVGYSLRAQA